MGFSFKPLWKVLVDKDMNKEDLRVAIKTSSATMTKMSKNEYVSMKILNDICTYLNCSISDVIEFVPDEKIINEYKK
ncbi:helix-turn-helix transcriptional regulator [Clostridium sp. C2-6-12]|uniref:helix-turn-helix domain-containing protein n=1 Tax=Clostridium sp. C2-6-12 TaxID=2698832 RepID=UPI00136E112B|nr:helix-turn-helix transcriptional regulator [Clostridium sp. C2-6-12]